MIIVGWFSLISLRNTCRRIVQWKSLVEVIPLSSITTMYFQDKQNKQINTQYITSPTLLNPNELSEDADQNMIWVFTVCLCPLERMKGLYGLKIQKYQIMSTCMFVNYLTMILQFSKPFTGMFKFKHQ